MAIIDIEGTRIAYDEAGAATAGPPVVLLHAFPLNRLMWQPQMEELRGAAHFVAPDMRGFGSSDVAEGTISMERMADDVHGLVESLGLAPVVLVGLSMGGYVALAYVRKYPGEVSGLMLADTRAAADTAEAREGRERMVEQVAASGPAAVAESMLPKLLSATAQENAELVAEVRRMIETTSAVGIVGALRGMAARPDSTELLGAIDLPGVVAVGTEDATIPAAEAEEMARRMPNCRFAAIEGAGHLSNLEQPAAFNAVLRDLLAEIGGGRA